MMFDIIVFVLIAVILIILVRKIPDEKRASAGQVEKERRWKFKLPSIKFDLPKISLGGKKVQTAPKEKELGRATLRQADELLSAGKTEEAEKIYLELAAQMPENPRIFNRLGVVYLKQKDYAEARDSFLQALRLDDTKGSRHYNLAMAYMGMKAKEKAKVSLKKALDIEPGNAKYKRALQKVEGES
jgi:tetratricopeptide (TPR) repeat protein